MTRTGLGCHNEGEHGRKTILGKSTGRIDGESVI